MKRIVSLLLTLCLLFSLTACKVKTDNTSTNDISNMDVNSSSQETTSDDNTTSDSQISDDGEDSQTPPQNDQGDTSSGQTPTTPTTPSTPSNPSTPNNPSGSTDTGKVTIPAYSGKVYVALNGNQPQFTAAELTTTAYEKYSELDSLGRCGVAIATCGKEIMPKPGEERGSISGVTPTGWWQKSYDNVPGSYLYNRCHLIGWQLSAENANNKNLITGTRTLNNEGMLPFENMIADYINETSNHVAYRVTPVYDGNNLLAKGVQLEAYSIEDGGEGICFNVFIYNVQEGITINYADGSSYLTSEGNDAIPPEEEDNTIVYTTKTGKKYHCTKDCSGLKNAKTIYEKTLSEAKVSKTSDGTLLTPCSICW